MAKEIDAMVRALMGVRGLPPPVGTPEHPPEWIGNKWYGNMFDAVDRANQFKRDQDKIFPQLPLGEPQFKFNAPINPMGDMEVNPDYLPDYHGVSPSGWNRSL